MGPRALVAALGLAAGLLGVPAATARQCFAFPKGADYAPLLAPKAAWLPSEDADPIPAVVDLRPLFEPSAAPDAGGVVFYSAVNGSLELTFDISRSLPLLDAIRLVGTGLFRVTIKDRYSTRETQNREQLQGVVDYPVYRSKDRTEAGQVVVQGLRPGSLLTALRLFASDRVVDDSWDDYDDGEVDPDEDHGWEQHDPPLAPEGCACSGWPSLGKTGSVCGVWDSDCNTTGGWCYVRPNACAGSVPSNSQPGMHWSCLPCNTSVPVSSPAPRAPPPPTPKSHREAPSAPDEATGCSDCHGALVLGLFGGLAVGVALTVLVLQRPRSVRPAMRRVDTRDPDEEELGHHD